MERPRVITTTYGKWLAISPDGMSLRIGVMGDTETEAVANWNRRVMRCREILGAISEEEAMPL